MSHPANPPGNPDVSPALDSLDLPRYGATVGEAVKRFFKKYVTFDGRASRSEYWWVMLLNAVVSVVCIALMAAGGASIFDATSTEMPDAAVPGLLLLLTYGLVTMIPNWALGMRRFHDCNLSGGLYFLCWVPYVGWPVVLILALMRSNPEGARFDRDSVLLTGQPTR